jgi:hypothetical protein
MTGKELAKFKRGILHTLILVIGFAIGLFVGFGIMNNKTTFNEQIYYLADSNEHITIVDNTDKDEENYTFDDLLDAIEWIESKGDANAVGDNGNAIGAYQIHKIYVRDINRFLGWNRFEYEDRYSKKLSREMTRQYISWYASRAYDDTRDSKFFKLEVMARIHNGGPKGYMKESTKPYWNKVKERMETTKRTSN